MQGSEKNCFDCSVDKTERDIYDIASYKSKFTCVHEFFKLFIVKKYHSSSFRSQFESAKGVNNEELEKALTL